MPTRYTADLDRMRDVVARMAKFDTALDVHLAKLDHRIARLHTSWTGDAAVAQRHAHDEWMRAAENMHHALTTMRSIAETAHGNYHAAVSTNVRMWDDAC